VAGLLAADQLAVVGAEGDGAVRVPDQLEEAARGSGDRVARFFLTQKTGKNRPNYYLITKWP
jgi:hypothetical protein